MKVPFYRHSLDESHSTRVAEVMSTPHLTYGEVAKQVEGQLSTFFKGGHAALTSSWSTGALAVFKSLGIGPGDEVIVPAMTFVASANIPLLCGAKVVLVDVEPETLLLDPSAVEAAVGPKTQAIMAVHLYGQMCDMAALRRIADAHGLALIEDAAHSFESARDGLVPAMVSDAAIFSFYATKNICCGEGGAVITRNDALYEKICAFRQHGMSASATDRFKRAQYQHWDVAEPGMKGSLPDILAAMLGPQIDRCLETLENRQAIANRYREAFGDVAGICMPTVVAGGRHAEHLFPIHVAPAKRDAVIAGLNAAGIGCTVNYRALHSLSLFEGEAVNAPHALAWGEGTVTLPLYPSLSIQAQDYVIASVCDVLAGKAGMAGAA